MKVPDWRTLALDEGIVPEPTAEDSRLVLWLPGRRDGGFQHWTRVSTLARPEITVRGGLCATAALAVPVRQPVRGLFGKLLGGFRPKTGAQTWLLPTGEAAEQHGPRQTDLILVWAGDDTAPLEEAHVQAQWPEGKEFKRIGKNLLLVAGVAPPSAPAAEAEQVPFGDAPSVAAEQQLAVARQSGDRRRQGLALADLGAFWRREGDARRALGYLEEALPLAREFGDRVLEADLLGQLGLAVLALGDARRALELLDQGLAAARAADDRFAEKAALELRGQALASLRNPAGAIADYEQALAFARAVGDRKHEAELLWYLGIEHAAQGQRDQALASAQAAVDLLEKTGKPQAAWFADHLQRYRKGDPGAGLGQPRGLGPGGVVVASGWAAPAGPAPTSPGVLRMAVSATKAMMKFLGSGLKTVTPATLQQRLGTCAACPHYTGVRCRLCGCFTDLKARMAHEECPIGKWPAE